jgi:hypothetical protein
MGSASLPPDVRRSSGCGPTRRTRSGRGGARAPGCSSGLTPKAKVAVSLNQDVLEQLRGTVTAGRARSVSAYVEHVVRAQYAAEIEFESILDEMLGNPARQARTAVLLRQRHVVLVALDDEDARRVGLLLAATSTSEVVDGHVALSLRTRRAVLNSEPDDIRRLAPNADIRRI